MDKRVASRFSQLRIPFYGIGSNESALAIIKNALTVQLYNPESGWRSQTRWASYANQLSLHRAVSEQQAAEWNQRVEVQQRCQRACLLASLLDHLGRNRH